MKAIHVPDINARYWAGITMASVFGTNMGDYYAHESGLGLIGGLWVLAAIVAVAYVAERFDERKHQLWYWLAIIVIRTGATNIADYLSFRVRLNMIGLCVGLAVLIAVMAWRPRAQQRKGLPQTDARYWIAMLAAGVFGTVLGDVCSHAVGEGVASLILGGLLAAVLLLGRKGLTQMLYYYWLTVAIARTAGTAIGDWLAESRALNIGLPTATLITGAVFLAVLLLWRSGARREPAAA
ncbi:MAG: hypothetical protein QM718_09800 [Steroidobacteraceae bacterium]